MTGRNRQARNASAYFSQGKFTVHRPHQPMPAITTMVLHTSVEKMQCVGFQASLNIFARHVQARAALRRSTKQPAAPASP